MPRALITNDDGIESPGLVALARATQSAGFDVLIAAPSWDSSGASSSLTGVQDDGRLTTVSRTIPGFDGVAYAVDAAPAMITVAALRGGFGEPPDVVVSGINCGRNTGHAVLHSGTVGAALTGLNHGASGVAVSLDAATPQHWDTAAHVAERVVRWLGRARPPAVINVNVPDLPLDGLRGLRQAPLAQVGAVQTTFTDKGEGYLHVTFEDADAPEPGSDAALLAEGWAVATPLRSLLEAGDVDVRDLLSTWTAQPRTEEALR